MHRHNHKLFFEILVLSIIVLLLSFVPVIALAIGIDDYSDSYYDYWGSDYSSELEGNEYNDGFFKYVIYDDYASIVGINDKSYAGKLSIPSSIGENDIPVSVIEKWAFSGCVGITEVEIPESVTTVCFGAFANCKELKSIKVDENNPYYCSVGNCLIDTECNSLIAGCKTSVIPNDGTVKSISDCAFYQCAGLKSIEIPDSVTEIFWGAFYNCNELTSIIIPDSVTSIYENAFSYCGKLSSVTIGNSVEKIYSSAFEGCSSLASITIPKSVNEIGTSAFAYCLELKSITVNEGNPYYCAVDNCLIETENKRLIAGCNNSKIPSDGSVTSIDDYAFCGLLHLAEIDIPDSVTGIGSNAFSSCARLKTIIIADSVTKIGYKAFGDCKEIADVYYIGTEQQKGKILIDNEDGGNDFLLNATWHYNCNPDNPICEHFETVIKNAKSATCNTEGYSGDVYCKICDWRIAEGESIAVTEHKYVWRITKLATATESGLKEEICTYCGEKTGKSQELLYTGHITGDIGSDGVVNNKDITRLFKYLSGWETDVNKAALDVNGDGKVNNKDLTRLFQYLSGWAVDIF